MHLIVALTFAALLAAAPPSPSVAPEPTLPEIGRVRATTAACAVVRDLVIPSFQAARASDTRFVETGKRLGRYAAAKSELGGRHGERVTAEALLHGIDSDTSTLLQNALVLNKALGDSRVAADVTDPQVLALREAMQMLYRTEMARAGQLVEFVARERVGNYRSGVDIEPTNAFATTQNHGSSPGASGTPAPDVAATAAPLMPHIVGQIAFVDAQKMNDWTTSINSYTKAGETEALRTFAQVADTCR